MESLDVPEGCECLHQDSDCRTSEDVPVAVVKDGDDELCFKVGDVISSAAASSYSILLG